MPILIKDEKRGWFYFRTIPFCSKAVTLIELIISVIIVSTVILSFYSIDTFSRNQVIRSERRTKVQNELSYALAHMNRYVQIANGYVSDPSDPNDPMRGIQYFPQGNPDGFQVQVDFNGTPSDFSDDAWVRYRFKNNNTIEASCSGGSCPASFINNENLTSDNRILTGFVKDCILSDPLPGCAGGGEGFFVNIADNGSSVDIGLIGRFRADAGEDKIRNPEVAMKAKLICHSCSTN